MHSRLTRVLLSGTALYLAGLFGWALLYTLVGDRWWWLFLLNSLAVYLFVPLLLVPAIALITRQHTLWLGFGLGAIIWSQLYGGLFAPSSQAQTHNSAPTLSIMTYNMLRHNHNPEPLLAAVRAADVDVVAIQELNEPIAAAIRQDLSDDYPYQVLDPGRNRAGMGVISRYPLYDTGETLPGRWIGTPQIVHLYVEDTRVTLFNVHALSTSMGYGGDLRIAPDRIEASIREREQQMHTLVTAVQEQTKPVIAVGDFNTTDTSDAYDIVAHEMQDAWRMAGTGLGHTFPGAATPGSSRPSVMGIRIPMWLVRIDYIFVSHHWQVREAVLGPWDGVSDHQPVVAWVTLNK